MDTKNPEEPGLPAEPLPGSPAALIAAIEALLPLVDDTYVAEQEVMAAARAQIEAARGTLTGNAVAYVFTDIGSGPEKLRQLADGVPGVVSRLHYGDGKWMPNHSLKVADATIILRVLTKNELLDGHVKALRAEQAKVLADAQAKATELDRTIQSLLAIDLKP